MHIHLSKVTRGDKTYRYAQLVESFRGADGRPTHRVVHSFGRLNDDQVANLRLAFQANRDGDSLVAAVPSGRTAKKAAAPLALAPPPAAPAVAPDILVRANLEYLDVAVLLRLWRDSGLAALVEDLLPRGEAEVGPDLVATALVLHRCVAPGSKLAAASWVPETALPELLAIQPGQFNNSRVHRVLEDLERVEAALQARLPHVVQRSHGAVVRLFIDATDTWLVGNGPPMAAKMTDKEGVYRRRVGIVLLCDQRGFPLRWRVLDGRYHDATALLDMAKEAAELDWVRDQHVVIDRAVGNAGGVQTLLESGLRFITALPWVEFESSRAPIPWDKLAALQAASLAKGATPESVTAAGTAHGFDHPRPDRLLLDLGIFDKAPPKRFSDECGTAVAMRFAEEIEAKSTWTHRQLAKAHHVSTMSVVRHRDLIGLERPLRRRVHDGEARTIGIDELRTIALLPAAEQRAAFDTAVARFPQRRVNARRTAPELTETVPQLARGVLYFNPRRCGEARKTDTASIARLDKAVAEINERITTPNARRTSAGILASVHKRILRAKMGNVLTATLDTSGAHPVVALQRDDDAWAARRKADGVCVMVTHPAVDGTPEDVVTEYFSRDVIEKDFRTIKSVVELRPIRHQTDVKLRAHVTICMLALLLQRLLGERLKTTAPATSAESALRTLAHTHLNLIRVGQREMYSITEPGLAQHSLLAALDMGDLARNDKLSGTITPR
jgi:hypothetical protein